VGTPVSCVVTISNDGNVGLSAFALISNASVDGYSLECTDASVLDAGATRNCQLNRTVNQVSSTPSGLLFWRRRRPRFALLSLTPEGQRLMAACVLLVDAYSDWMYAGGPRGLLNVGFIYACTG
jgi:hypothetical protein